MAVVKLAQPGFDVKTAGDENLIYNSNWPTLKIYKQGKFASSDSSTINQLVTNHDLGYVPAFWTYSNNSAINWNQGPITVDRRSEFMGPQTFFPGVTKDKMVYDINQIAAFGTQQFYYYIFALDITKEYKAPTIKVGAIGGAHSSKKFKIAKPDKSIDSANLEDFVIHSDCRTPLIHAVHYAVTAADNSIYGHGFTYTHGLGYVPMILAYVSTDGGFYGVGTPTPGSWLQLLLGLGTVDGFTIDEQKISYSTIHDGEKISLVILKDPFNIDYQINVSV